MRIYRVAVRGRFGDLDAVTRARLVAAADDHDYIHARFTPAGTLAYEPTLQSFTFRYELRVADDEDGPVDRVTAAALEQAAAAMAEAGIEHGALRVQVSDMADVWK